MPSVAVVAVSHAERSAPCAHAVRISAKAAGTTAELVPRLPRARCSSAIAVDPRAASSAGVIGTAHDGAMLAPTHLKLIQSAAVVSEAAEGCGPAFELVDLTSSAGRVAEDPDSGFAEAKATCHHGAGGDAPALPSFVDGGL